MTQFSPLTIANTFVQRHGGEVGIEHMKLQKLVYFLHGWWLAYEPERLVSDQPEVWKYGPVFGNMYNALAWAGRQPLREPCAPNPFSNTHPAVVTDEATNNLVDWIWNRYGGYSAITLSDLTHKSGTPWRTIAEQYNYSVPKHLKIPDELVADYFKSERQKLEAA